MDTEKFYTVQVILCRIDEQTKTAETHEFRDCTAARAGELRNDVFVKGVRINHSPMSWEVISPIMIKQFFIIQQDKKFAP